MSRIEWLMCEHFTGRVGEQFDATAGDGMSVPLELVEATENAAAGRRGPDGQEHAQFSLVFAGPATPALAQATYPVQHPDFEDLVLFLVPLGPEDGRMRYEAAFA